jgi:carbon-monoxide dehydrogenase large subunit
VTFAIEQLVDEAARQLGVDRIALRRKNLISPKAFPYRNSVGMLYDSGHYEENMDWAMEIADWKGFPARRREAKRRGKLLGRGLANYVESSIGAPKEQARIKVRPDGRPMSMPSSARNQTDRATRPASPRLSPICFMCPTTRQHHLSATPRS